MAGYSKSPEGRRQSKNEYYKRRRAKIIAYLGGKCVRCGSTSELEIDHKDHTKKAFDISKNFAIAWTRLVPELDKCQLLCNAHHLDKTAVDQPWTKSPSNQPKGPIHGSAWTYFKHKCRCNLCVEAKRRSYVK